MERRMNLSFILTLRLGIALLAATTALVFAQYEEAEGTAETLSPAHQTVLASAVHPAVDLVMFG